MLFRYFTVREALALRSFEWQNNLIAWYIKEI